MAISSLTKRLLLAKSGGYCQNPECNTNLYSFFETGRITNIEELAHIIGQQENGPRGNVSMSASERDEYDNLIILCPNCHTKVDKNPEIYSTKTLRLWKTEHEMKIDSSFNAPKFENRYDMFIAIQKLLSENNAVFKQYGPQSEYARTSIQSDAAKMWEIKSIDTIIPNNRRICEILSNNYRLLNENELEVFNNFKIHKEGFEYNKLSGDKNSSVPLFPNELYKILK